MNADEPNYLISTENTKNSNLFSYCGNNPINYIDPTGKDFVAIFTALLAIIGAALGAYMMYSYCTEKGYTVKDGWKFWQYILGGIVLGGVAGSVIGHFAGVYFGASGIVAGKLASSSGVTMAQIRALGKLGETLAGIVKNTAHIVSLTGTANYRIPDVLDHVNRIIGDVKYVNTLYYTQQLKDYLMYAQRYSYKLVLFIKPDTKISKTIKDLVEAGKIIIVFITEGR